MKTSPREYSHRGEFDQALIRPVCGPNESFVLAVGLHTGLSRNSLESTIGIHREIWGDQRETWLPDLPGLPVHSGFIRVVWRRAQAAEVAETDSTRRSRAPRRLLPNSALRTLRALNARAESS